MAVTRLTDVIIPDVYATYGSENTPEKTAFFESGVVLRNAVLDAKANSGGTTIDLPFWKDLDSSIEPNGSTDDPAVTATPQNIKATEQIARVSYLNQGWSTADLVGEIAGSSPMERIRQRTSTYWQRQWQRRILAAAVGVAADNAANDAGDMTISIAAEATGSQTDATRYNRSAFIEAAFTFGDSFDAVQAIAVHSVVYKAMVKAEDVDYIPDSQGNLTIPTYFGKRVIVDDGMPVTAGTTSGFKYTSILFGPGAFGYGEGTPEVPVEVARSADKGNGGGVETLWERKTWILHPAGYKFLSATVTGQSPTLANLKLAANWDRVATRKLVPLAFVITN